MSDMEGLYPTFRIMRRACAIALSLVIAALAGFAAVRADTERPRFTKSSNARAPAQPNKRAPLQGPTQAEKSRMDRASAPSNGAGGGGGGM